eukprot:GHVN01006197.1.p1 GENE.GHVN01006197.1~~GHVN01006197.1.p1  ORF type:complete len:400 (-),score=33.11 GHVN01006197.1:198-1397(-)
MVIVEHCDSFWSCTRAYTVSVLCFSTFLFFVYIFWKLSRSYHPVPKTDLAILILSAVQTFLGFVYYGLWEFVEIVLAVRALKVFQATVISWLFVIGLAQNEKTKCRLHGVFAGLCGFVVVSYIVVLSLYKPSKSACRDASWLLLSVSGLVMALAVAGLGLRSYFVLMRSTDQQTADHVMIPVRQIAESSNSAKDLTNDATPAQNDSSADTQSDVSIHRSPTTSGTGISPTGHPKDIGRVSGYEPNGLSSHPSSPLQLRGDRQGESFFGVKRRQLLVLVFIEALSASITLMWDIILLKSVKPSETSSCEYFLSHIPVLELVAYITTRVVGTLLPHWAIIYVFYWADRVVYEPLRQQWDIQLGNVEVGPAMGDPFEGALSPGTVHSYNTDNTARVITFEDY